MKKQPKKIIVHREQHQPSMHVVGDFPKNISQVKQQEVPDPRLKHYHDYFLPVYNWLKQLSLGSLVLYLFLVLSKVTVFIFRLPTSKEKVQKKAPKVMPKMQMPKKMSYSFNIPKYFTKYAGVSLAVLVLVLSGYTAEQSLAQIKDQVTNNAEQGINSLISATNALNEEEIVRAQILFASAEQSFVTADSQTDYLPEWMMDELTNIPYLNTVGTANKIFELATEVSKLGQEIALSKAQKPQSNTILLASDVLSADQALLNEQLLKIIEDLQSINPRHLPKDYRGWLREAQSSIFPQVARSIAEANNINTVLNELLGVNEKQRFFLAFQNSNEIRASGGFMGSYAIVDILNGEIVKLEVPSGGTYDVQGQQTASLAPPPALSLVASRWELQDSNWWIDWPTSARQISSFYESAGGSSVDGVIAVNSKFLETTLEIIGPVYISEYDITLTADNVIYETQSHIETGYDPQKEKPKQILNILTPIILERLQEEVEKEPVKLAQSILGALKNKDIQVYSNDLKTAEALTNLKWDGRLPIKPNSDLLAIVHSNIAGQKTDAVMKNDVDYEVVVGEDGIARAKLILTREHQGIKGDLFTGVRNVDFVRIYVPKGSSLISTKGFEQPDGVFFDAHQKNVTIPANTMAEHTATVDGETSTMIYDELGYTVFGNWIMTDPGQTSSVTLTYRLPFNYSSVFNNHSSWMNVLANNEEESARYQFNWIQQPGLGPVEFNHSFRSELGIDSIVSTLPVQTMADGWQWQNTLLNDHNIIVDLK